MLLEAKSLVKKFGDKVAVDKVSISLDRGQCLALLGPNGAGKTTTCEMLEGLTPFDAGSVRIMGLDLKKDRIAIYRKIGVQLQETHLYKRFTVEETLQLFASFYQCDPSVVKGLLGKLDLTSQAKTQLGKLSGGYRQRVYLGCALVNNPEVLFLDEPTTGLDPKSRRDLWEIIQSLKQEGRGILLTTHYMEEAQFLADCVAVIDRGKIIAEGTPKELIDKFAQDKLVMIHMNDEDSAKQAEVKLKAKLDLSKSTIDGSLIRIPVAGFDKATADLMTAISSLDIDVHSIELRDGTLEDVFLNITGRSFEDVRSIAD